MPKFKHQLFAPSAPVWTQREVQRVDENGVVRVTYVDVDLSDPANSQEMPTFEEMSFPNQQSAGFPMQQAPTNFLNPSDPLSGTPSSAEIDYAFEQMLDEAEQSELTPEPTPEPEPTNN